MKRIFKRSLKFTSNSYDPLGEHKRKTLMALLWVFGSFAVITVGFMLLVKFAVPNFMPILDQKFFLMSGVFFFLVILIVALIERYLSVDIACLLFNLLFFAGIFLSDTLPELVNGRSLIMLIIPVVTFSVLLRPWAGYVVAGIFSLFITLFHVYYHLGLPNIPAILALILVAFIVQQATSNLERVVQLLQQTKQTLQTNEERFRALIESSTDVNAILSHDGTVQYVSPSVERLLGYKAEDFIGKNILAYLHPEDVEIASAALGPEIPAEAIGPLLILQLHHANDSWVTVEVIGKEMHSHPAIMGTVVNCRDITERKQAETKLRESEEIFSKAFQLSPMPMAISGPDGEYIEINQAFTQTLGYQYEELVGRTPSEIDLFNDPGQSRNAVQILKEQGRLGGYEMAVKTRSGDILNGVFFAEPMQLNNRPMVLTLMNDITERKRIEDNLRESEEKYHRMIETLPIGVIVHQDGLIQLINPTGAKILGGKNPEEFIGKPILDLVHPDFRHIVQMQIKASRPEQMKGELFYEKLVRLDGTNIDVEVVMHPITFDRMASRLLVFADITERQHAEEALKKSAENFRNLSENTADGILIGAPDGRHLYANRQACKLLGYSPEEIIRTSQEDISDPVVYPLLKKRLQDRIAGRPVPKTYEINLRRKDGTYFPVEISGTRTIWQDQNCDLVLFRDITDRKQAQEAIKFQNQRTQEVSRQLLEVQEREKRLIATELHDDLGQSLTSLKLMLELATSTPTASKQQKAMGDSLELIAELMGKVRNLSLDLRPAMLDDFGLFTAFRWLFERIHTQTGIVIRCNYNLDSDQRFAPDIETAAFRITQEALTNVARHAAVQEAWVNLEIGKNLSIEITDQGAGFGTLLEAQDFAGSIGLSGMQERARLIGGKVEIFSKLGSGTRVLATIPLTGGTL